MDTKLAILLTAAQTLNETAIATALLIKAVHAWDGSDETSGDLVKFTCGSAGELRERNDLPQCEQDQVSDTYEVATPTAESAAPVEEVTAATPPAKPRTPRKPKAEVVKAPEPEVEQVQEDEPEVTKAPEPEVEQVQEDEPEVTKAPEPEVEQVQEVEPEVTKAPEPEVEKPAATKKTKEYVNPLVGKTAEDRLTTLKQILTSGTALKNYTQADVRTWIQGDFNKTGLSLLTEEEQIAFYDDRLARFN